MKRPVRTLVHYGPPVGLLHTGHPEEHWLWDCGAPMSGLAGSVNQCTAGIVIASDLPGAFAMNHMNK